MKLTPLQKRAERKARNGSQLDMNLVSLIDIFTILIFFLLSSATGVELLASPKAVHLPESTALKPPTETVVVVVNADEILVEGRRVASVSEALASDGELIASLKDELDVQSSRKALNAAKQAITIMGDKDIPYRLLRKVMVTAARSNFSDMSFAVRQKVGA
jgi:biopolymer transport protein ExbD